MLGNTSWYSIDISGNDRHILLFYKKRHFCHLIPFAKVGQKSIHMYVCDQIDTIRCNFCRRKKKSVWSFFQKFFETTSWIIGKDSAVVILDMTSSSNLYVKMEWKLAVFRRYVRPLRPPFHALPAVPKHIFFIDQPIPKVRSWSLSFSGFIARSVPPKIIYIPFPSTVLRSQLSTACCMQQSKSFASAAISGLFAKRTELCAV